MLNCPKCRTPERLLERDQFRHPIGKHFVHQNDYSKPAPIAYWQAARCRVCHTTLKVIVNYPDAERVELAEN